MSFTAKYESECENCPASLEVGQEAVVVDFDKQLYAHARCPVPPKPQPTCPVCHLQHAGEC